MKKLLLTLLFLMNVTYADYTFMIPLEQSGGGVLPNNSITFGNVSETNPPENVTEQYSAVIDLGSLTSSSSSPFFDDITYPLWGSYGINLRLSSRNVSSSSIVSAVLTDYDSNLITLPISDMNCINSEICTFIVNNNNGSNLQEMIFNGGSIEIKVNYVKKTQ